MNHLGTAYNIKKRSAKMAKGGMAHCAHGGPAYCSQGCYADGGMVEEMHPEMDSRMDLDTEKMSMKDKAYEDSMDEPMDEPNNMKMAKGGMMHPKNMAKSIMMAKGGMVNSEEALEESKNYQLAQEDQPEMGSDREDIDLKWDTPHDDDLSSEGDYPLMEEEGYEEGHQAKMRRKGGLLDRVMAKLHG